MLYLANTTIVKKKKSVLSLGVANLRTNMF